MPFVSIEGIDGCGKTAQVKLLSEHLRNAGRTVLQTKEPDGGHLGSEVRAILTRSDRQLTPTEQLLLVSAARFDHVHNVIRPALANGQWVDLRISSRSVRHRPPPAVSVHLRYRGGLHTPRSYGDSRPSP